MITAAHKDIIRMYSLDPRSDRPSPIMLTRSTTKQLKTERYPRNQRKLTWSGQPVAVALSTVNYVISAMLNGEPTNNLLETITEEIYNKATVYVQHLYAQKQMFSEFIKAILEPVTEKPRIQPTSFDIKSAILRFPGRLLTFQAFKKYGARCLRSVQKQEYPVWPTDAPCTRQEYQQRIYRATGQTQLSPKKHS